MKCKNCKTEFYASKAYRGMGDPATPLAIISKGSLLAIIGITLGGIGWFFVSKLLTILGLMLFVALPVALLYIKESKNWYQRNKGGKCPSCGTENKIKFYTG